MYTTQPVSLVTLSASPRNGGNSDAASGLFCNTMAVLKSGPQDPSAPTLPPSSSSWLFLRNYAVLPCTGCDACAKGAAPHFNSHLGCPQALHDTSIQLIRKIAHAKALCIVAPIYNYHLPAQCKALLDRLQPFWQLWNKKSACLEKLGQDKPCFVILIAGRPKGEKLFEGSLLSLRYALHPIGFTLKEPLLLRGHEGKNSIAQSEEAKQRIASYAQYATAELAKKME